MSRAINYSLSRWYIISTVVIAALSKRNCTWGQEKAQLKLTRYSNLGQNFSFLAYNHSIAYSSIITSQSSQYFVQRKLGKTKWMSTDFLVSSIHVLIKLFKIISVGKYSFLFQIVGILFPIAKKSFRLLGNLWHFPTYSGGVNRRRGSNHICLWVQ